MFDIAAAIFWELLDEIIDAVFLVLIGMEVLRIDFSTHLFVGGQGRCRISP